MDSFTKKEQIVILVIVLTITSFIGFKFVIKDLIASKNQTLGLVSGISNETNSDIEIQPVFYEEEKVIIMVHVSGQVFNPGIVKLFQGDRVIDAIELAGGVKKEADVDRINLAKKLVDEEKIHIPKIGEEINIEIASNNQNNYSSVSGTGVSNTGGKININQCSSSELESLPGIGQVLAGRIIDYRNSNPFKNIEELKNVSGIGEKKFEAIKELITVK